MSSAEKPGKAGESDASGLELAANNATVTILEDQLEHIAKVVCNSLIIGLPTNFTSGPSRSGLNIIHHGRALSKPAGQSRTATALTWNAER